MQDQHITKIDQENGYRARCVCGWRSEVLRTRKAAVNAAAIHRANALVQKL